MRSFEIEIHLVLRAVCHLHDELTTHASPRRARAKNALLVLVAEHDREVRILAFERTEGTIKNHVSNILAKLQAENRTQAAHIARKQGLV